MGLHLVHPHYDKQWHCDEGLFGCRTSNSLKRKTAPSWMELPSFKKMSEHLRTKKKGKSPLEYAPVMTVEREKGKESASVLGLVEKKRRR